MRTRRLYSEEDKARAYVVWVSNDRMMKRTARGTGFPEGTIRGWIREWEENGPPSEQIDKIAEFAGEFVEDATRIRNLALRTLETQISNGDVKAAQLVAAVAVLTDKITMTKGLATSRVEHVHALPAPEELANSLGQALQAALREAELRDSEIIDAEVIALPSAK